MLEIKTSEQIREVKKAKIEKHQTTFTFCEPDNKKWVRYTDVLRKIRKDYLSKEIVREVVTAYLCKYSCRKDDKLRKLRDGILKELRLKNKRVEVKKCNQKKS